MDGHWLVTSVSWLRVNCVRSLVLTVEGLYCKRPIQCLASSELLTPHPLTARRVCTPPPLVRGGGHTRGGREGGGSIVRKTPDTALYSIICNYLVVVTSVS